MDIDADHLGIPETEYSCVVKMPASEFQKVCRDLNVLGETCVISVNKEGVKFSVSGDLGKGNITRKHSTTADNVRDLCCFCCCVASCCCVYLSHTTTRPLHTLRNPIRTRHTL